MKHVLKKQTKTSLQLTNASYNAASGSWTLEYTLDTDHLGPSKVKSYNFDRHSGSEEISPAEMFKKLCELYESLESAPVKADSL